jgi:hypothetical protein
VTTPTRIFLFIILILGFGTSVSGEQSAPADPKSVLWQYVELRLRWADWKDYSQFITWPDEPGWDCWWVADAHHVGQEVAKKSKVFIPVTYNRIGLYCADDQFRANLKKETVNYEMLKKKGKWKVNGPVPDYPYISKAALRDWLNKSTQDSSESAERKEQAQEVLKALSEDGRTR